MLVTPPKQELPCFETLPASGYPAEVQLEAGSFTAERNFLAAQLRDYTETKRCVKRQ